MKRNVTTQELPRTFEDQFSKLQTWGVEPTYARSGLAMQHTCDYRAKHSMRVFVIERVVALAHRTSRKACTVFCRAKSSVGRVKISLFISD